MHLQFAPSFAVGIGFPVIAAMLLCCTAAGAGEAAPANDPAWESRFFAEYPTAVSKLKEAVDQVRISAHYRRRYGADPALPWTDLQFLKDRDSLRIQLRSPAIAGRPAEENVGIVAPGHALLAKDPSEPWRMLQYSGNQPDNSLRVFSEMYCWRFLGCTFGLGREATLQDDIQTGRVVVTGVTRPDKEHGWVRVNFRFREEAEDPQFTATGTGYAIMDPQASWCIREACVFSGPPFNLEVHQFVDALESLPSGHVIARQFRMLGYDLRPDSTTPVRKNEQVRECMEYELLRAEEEASPGSEFTAAALGFPEISRASSTLGMRIGAALLALALFVVWRRWLRNPTMKNV